MGTENEKWTAVVTANTEGVSHGTAAAAGA